MLAIDLLSGEYEGGKFVFHGRCPFFDVELISCYKDTTYQASKQASKMTKSAFVKADFWIKRV
jgi:hypothetical protein